MEVYAVGVHVSMRVLFSKAVKCAFVLDAQVTRTRDAAESLSAVQESRDMS